MAALLVTLPNPLLTIARNRAPLSACTTDASVYSARSLRQCWHRSAATDRSGGVPEALTLKVTDAPGATVRLAGCCVMLGRTEP